MATKKTTKTAKPVEKPVVEVKPVEEPKEKLDWFVVHGYGWIEAKSAEDAIERVKEIMKR